MSTSELPILSQPATATAATVSIGEWSPDSSEARDFYHRIRMFPPEVSKWRKRFVSLLMDNRTEFPAITEDMTGADVRGLVDEGISFLREITRLLGLLYPSSLEQRETLPLGAESSRLGETAMGVLKRLSPYRKLGLAPEILTEELRRVVLTEFVPPGLSASLNGLLEQHAEQVCRPEPECGGCEIRNFCSAYRKSEAARMDALNLPTVVDLFCCAGGSSEGFSQAGFHVLLGLDLDETALRSYWLNHPWIPDERVLSQDIREMTADRLNELLEGRPVDVLIGSPPCQGFSHVGHRCKSTKTGYTLAGDERNLLFNNMVDLAIALKPKLFLMENVPGMQSARSQDRSFMEIAAARLEKEGDFRTELWRLNAAAYGVPQDRTRYFLVASSTGSLPLKPVEEYQDGSGGEFRPLFDEALPAISVDEAIYDLPPREANSGEIVEVWDPSSSSGDRRFRRYLKRAGVTNQSRFLYNHWARYHNSRDLELYDLLKPGEDSVHAIEKYGREDLMRYRKDVFDDKYARLRSDRPSKTIVSHLAKDGNGFIHPSQVRSITVREAARLQSFPDGFIFCGSPSDQWAQVGNAVPPLLAKLIAGSFLKTLRRENRKC